MSGLIFKISNKKQFLLGLLGLSAGVLFYLIARPKGATYFQYKIPWLNGFLPHLPHLQGYFAGSFPEFIHPFSFSLIGMGLASRTRRSRIAVCSTLLLLNLFFEIGQKYKGLAISVIPDWFEALPVLDNTGRYFCVGTFSISDLIATCLGALAAFLIGDLAAWLSKRRQ